MAKIIMGGSPSSFYTKNGDVLTKTIIDMSETMIVEMAEKWVGVTEGYLRDEFKGEPGRYINEVRVRCEKTEKYRPL